MQIRGGFKLAFDSNAYTPLLLMVHIHPERQSDLIAPECLTLFPETTFENYTDVFGNICTRLIAPPCRFSIWNRFVISDSGIAESLPLNEPQLQVNELPSDVLIYLLGSRYCETQKLKSLAWANFGGYQEGWARVQAILQYTHDRIQFSYPNARSDRTAWEAHEERTGVCRDYTHLAITLCRCLNIPARYCTGYLGDIGVPLDVNPMDFSAWFEVYLGGSWYSLDARHNKPRIGRILMARGRDAVDTALSTAFGVANLSEFTVITEEVTPFLIS